MGTNKMIYKTSTVLLVLVFSLAGMLKITPALYPPAYNELKSEFGDFVRVPPVDLLRLEPTIYMLIVGVIEVVCAGLIAIGNYRLGKLATWCIVVVMVGAIYTLFSVGRAPPQFIPASVCLALALARLYTMGAFNQVEVKIKI